MTPTRLDQYAEELWYQTQPGAHTYGPCPDCKAPSRGCGLCPECIDKDLTAQGIDITQARVRYRFVRVDGRLRRKE